MKDGPSAAVGPPARRRPRVWNWTGVIAGGGIIVVSVVFLIVGGHPLYLFVIGLVVGLVAMSGGVTGLRSKDTSSPTGSGRR